MPVQPMKTIAAVALGEDPLTTNEILVAGFFVSAIVFALGATKTMDAFNRLAVGGGAGHASGLGDVIGAERLRARGVCIERCESRAEDDGRGWIARDDRRVLRRHVRVRAEYPPASTAAGADAGELGATTEAKERKKRVRHYVPTALILVVVGIVMAMTKKVR